MNNTHHLNFSVINNHLPDKVEILTTKIPVAYLGYTNVGACICSI